MGEAPEQRAEEEHPAAQQQDALRVLQDRTNLRRLTGYGEFEIDIEDIFLAESEEPKTYDEALESVDSDSCKLAMDAEMDSLHENNTWQLVQAPPNTKVLPNRWVYRLKPGIGARDARYKAQLVVKSFSQRPGIDYEETFSPVVKFGSIRGILVIAAMSNIYLMQFDVKTAFLNGDLGEGIFIAQPKGFEYSTGRVCRLRKALYVLKQAARCWNKKFVECLKRFSMVATPEDPCVFISHHDDATLILAIYIDDGLIAPTSKTKIEGLLQYFLEILQITISPLGVFSCIEIEQR